MQKKIIGMASLVQKTGETRTTGFLNDREQELAAAAANKCGCDGFEFYGGYENAERKQMCLIGYDLQPVYNITRIKIDVKGGTDKLTHRDYLGALMALGIKRECMGDILLNDSGAILFAEERMADFICRELFEIGRSSANAQLCTDEGSEEAMPGGQQCTANVQSLRLDSVLAAMLKASRASAVKLIESKAVMINHIAAVSAHAPIYDNDIITVKGKGKYKIIETEGRSKKGRIFVTFIQY